MQGSHCGQPMPRRHGQLRGRPGQISLLVGSAHHPGGRARTSCCKHLRMPGTLALKRTVDSMSSGISSVTQVCTHTHRRQNRTAMATMSWTRTPAATRGCQAPRRTRPTSCCTTPRPLERPSMRCCARHR